MPKLLQFDFNQSPQGWLVVKGSWTDVWTRTRGFKHKADAYDKATADLILRYPIDVGKYKKFIFVIPCHYFGHGKAFNGDIYVRLIKNETVVASFKLDLIDYSAVEVTDRHWYYAAIVVFESPPSTDYVEIELYLYIGYEGGPATALVETDNIAFYVEFDDIYYCSEIALIQRVLEYLVSTKYSCNKYALRLITNLQDLETYKFFIKRIYEGTEYRDEYTSSTISEVINADVITGFGWDLRSKAIYEPSLSTDEAWIVLLDANWFPIKLIRVTSRITAAPFQPEQQVMGISGTVGYYETSTSRWLKAFAMKLDLTPKVRWTDGNPDWLNYGYAVIKYLDRYGNLIDQQVVNLKTYQVNKTVHLEQQYLENVTYIVEYWYIDVAYAGNMTVVMDMDFVITPVK